MGARIVGVILYQGPANSTTPPAGVEPGQIMDRPTLTIHLVKITGETTQAQDPAHLQEVEIQAKEAREVDEHIHRALLQADRGNERSAQESEI